MQWGGIPYIHFENKKSGLAPFDDLLNLLPVLHIRRI